MTHLISYAIKMDVLQVPESGKNGKIRESRQWQYKQPIRGHCKKKLTPLCFDWYEY